nr:hypothetical protein [Streptomyces sp. SLBN-31]
MNVAKVDACRRQRGGHVVGDEAQPGQSGQLHGGAEHVLGSAELPQERLVGRGEGELTSSPL